MIIDAVIIIGAVIGLAQIFHGVTFEYLLCCALVGIILGIHRGTKNAKK